MLILLPMRSKSKGVPAMPKGPSTRGLWSGTAKQKATIMMRLKSCASMVLEKFVSSLTAILWNTSMAWALSMRCSTKDTLPPKSSLNSW